MKKWIREHVFATITLTILATLVAVIIFTNVTGSEKRVQRVVQHRYANVMRSRSMYLE